MSREVDSACAIYGYASAEIIATSADECRVDKITTAT